MVKADAGKRLRYHSCQTMPHAASIQILAMGINRHLERSLATFHDAQRFVELTHGIDVRDHAAHIQFAGGDEIDRTRIGVRAEMRAEYVQFLAVADDRPVERDFAAEYGKLDEPPQFAQHVNALVDRRMMPGGFDIDVTAVAIGDGLDL